MIEIDGSFGEGGGQILRTALALAAALGKHVRIHNIRAARPEPGLRAQHLTGVKAIAEICSASLQGVEIGSTEFVFMPGKPRAGHYRFDVGTAGSVTLVLQTLMPLLPFISSKSTFVLTGGTDVKWSPPVDYLRLVSLPVLETMGYHGNLRLMRRGHYPKGGGIVIFEATPAAPLKALLVRTTDDLVRIVGVSHAVRLPRHVAERQAVAAQRVILEEGFSPPQVDLDSSENGVHLGPGSGLVLSAIRKGGAILGADSLGERGMPAERVGSDAAKRLVEELESSMFLDRHMGDMVVPYIALAEGISEVSVSRVTQHTLTNVKVAEWVAGVHFDSVGEVGSPGLLRAKGLGLRCEEVSASSKE